MFEIVKMTHVCQYWRSTLISYPRLWSSIFVRNDHRDFVAACLERNRGAPLTVHLNLARGGEEHYPDCICIRDEWSSRMRVNERNPCRYHTTIYPLLEVDHTRRIRTLDVYLTLFDDYTEEHPDYRFEDALDNFGLFKFSLPALQSLSFHVDHEFDTDNHLEFPADMFCWRSSPPTKLRHLTLHDCYGGPIRTVRNLTSFELIRGENTADAIELDEFTFLPFLSGNRSLVSLSLSDCSFPDPAQLSSVAPVTLPELKSLQLMDNYGLSGFLRLANVPALKSLSSLRILVRNHLLGFPTQVYTESDDGFQLSYNPPDDADVVSDWLDAVHGPDPSLSFIRFEGWQPELTVKNEMKAFPPSLFMKAKVLEIGACFARLGYPDFWEDLEQVGPQLVTLRLEVIKGMKPVIAQSVEKFVKARFDKGVPLAQVERMRFEGVEDEEKTENLWKEFRGGLNIDQYLSPS